MKEESEDICTFYYHRGDPDNRIKEMKMEIFSDRTSRHRFHANALRLLLHALAFILMTLLREMFFGAELTKCTIGQICLKLLRSAITVEASTN